MTYLGGFLTCLATGAILRRWWGGWLAPSGLAKRAAVFAFGALFALCFLPWWASLAVGGVMLAAFLNTLHGEGMDLGGWGGSYWGDIATHSLTYGAATTLMAAIVSFTTGTPDPLWGALGGFLSPLGYIVSKHFMGDRPYRFGYSGLNAQDKPMYFIDGYTAVGELWLGACLFGSLWVVLWIAMLS